MSLCHPNVSLCHSLYHHVTLQEVHNLLQPLRVHGPPHKGVTVPLDQEEGHSPQQTWTGQRDRGTPVPGMNTCSQTETHTATTHEHTETDRYIPYTDTLKHTHHTYAQHIHTHTHTYVQHIHTHTHTYVHTHIHTHNVHIIFRRTYVHAYLPTSDGDGSHSIVDHTACEVCQQDAGGCQEHTCHCCTVLHQHCHSTGVLTTNHWREGEGEGRKGRGKEGEGRGGEEGEEGKGEEEGEGRRGGGRGGGKIKG